MAIKRINTRFIEVNGGFLLIFSVLSVLIAFLLNFDYTLPNATFEEDVDFLVGNIDRQKISAISWLISGMINLIFMPVYLILFNRFQRIIHLINSFFILGMAWSFVSIGLHELNIAKILQTFMQGGGLNGEVTEQLILPVMRKIILLHQSGLTAFGAFAFLFAVSRFSDVKFPLFKRILPLLAGPLIIIFIWLDSDHILLTVSLAAAWTGLLLIGVRIVNRGLKLKIRESES